MHFSLFYNDIHEVCAPNKADDVIMSPALLLLAKTV